MFTFVHIEKKRTNSENLKNGITHSSPRGEGGDLAETVKMWPRSIICH